MKIFDFYKKEKTPLVLALGFFDSIHIGHCEIIKRCQSLAKSLSATDCVFTFKNDISSVVSKSKGLVFTYEERLKKLEKLQVKSIISTSFTNEFSKIESLDFLKTITDNFNVLAVVCGEDYTFGKGGKGRVNDLKDFCSKRGIKFEIVKQIEIKGQKISTSLIKEELSLGRIESANELLGSPYFITGEVIKDRQVGRCLGFPTANIPLNAQKLPLKLGVYHTLVELDGVKYDCITNFGARPTFGLNDVLTETYIDGFNGDLYGKSITVNFKRFLRDLIKFNSAEELKAQLKKDLGTIR